MKRLKRGEFIAMTPEQQKEHKAMLQIRWRKKNPDKVKQMNHKWALYYWYNKPFKCICQKCGKEFGAARKYFVTCQECIQARIAKNKAIRDLAIAKAKAKAERNKEIIRLHKKGLLQREIAERVDIDQAGVSYVLRKNGYRTQEQRKRTRK
jgi:DNA-binding MarR family transcriptional regulator